MNRYPEKGLIGTVTDFIGQNGTFFEKLAVDIERRTQQFNKINSARIRIALENFSLEMKYSLFEVLFFLHVNSDKYSAYQFSVFKESEGKKHTDDAITKTSRLFVPEAPFGVAGLSSMNPAIGGAFQEYCASEFKLKSIPKFDYNTFLSICSIGSVGTIAHKPEKSDLDIQIQYDLFPSDIPSSFLTSEKIETIIVELNQALLAPDESEEAAADFSQVEVFAPYIKSRFRNLLYFLRNSEAELSPEIVGKLIKEIDELYRTHIIVTKKNELKKKEFLIQNKIKLVHEHVTSKFPNADIFFFSYTTDNYRRGQHGTTKKSKEASGSAYELILNYETLLPGIQFNDCVPSHFMFNEAINQNQKKYNYLISLIRLGLAAPLKKFHRRYVDLGNAPYISKKYVVEHFGAVYWEAFKASQGNLAKALLNLLRIEVLMWKDVTPSIINCIKDRNLYQTTLSADNEDEFGLKISSNKLFTQQEIAEAEAKLPHLSNDPWWIRYKILKYSYENPPGIINPLEARQICRMIDICFAIHINLGEVVEMDSANGKNSSVSYRKNFLFFFYNNAFPPFSETREKINNIFIGDTDEIRNVEKEMKMVFHNCIQRVEFYSKINSNQYAGNREEFQIWHHYFKKYFNPRPNMVQTSILKNHKQQRNKLVISYKDKNWFFFSIYEKEFKKFQAISMADKQGKVELFRHHHFLHGFAYCILNNYFSVALKGSIRKALSSVEVNFSGYNEQKDKIISRMPQDGADRIGRFILERFVKFPVDYRDTLKPDIPIRDLCIFLNLMIFGKLDILYRDNLNNWYVTAHTFDIIRSKSKILFENIDDFLGNHEMFEYLLNFCVKAKMPKKLILSNLYFWINPVSLTAQGSTEHKLALFEKKFKENFNTYVEQHLKEPVSSEVNQSA